MLTRKTLQWPFVVDDNVENIFSKMFMFFHAPQEMITWRGPKIHKF